MAGDGTREALLGCLGLGVVMAVVTGFRVLANSIREITKWDRRNK